MKTLLLPLLLIISGLLLIGSTCHAQPKDSDRDWIDSLAVKYRTDFIKSAMLRDQAMLDSIEASVYALIFNLQNGGKLDQTTIDTLVKAVRQYDDERQAQQLRRLAYKEEMRSARTDFSAL